MGTMQTGSLANVNIGQNRSQAVGHGVAHLTAVNPYSIIVTLSFNLKNSTVTVCVQDVQKGVTTWNIKLCDLNVQPNKHVYGYYESQGTKFVYFTVSGNRT